MNDIYDIKESFFTLSPWALVFLVVCGAFLLLFILLFLHKKLKKKPLAKKLPSHALFFENLSKLKKENLEIKKYFFQLSRLLKNYLENRFLIEAGEKTTEELKKDLQIPEINSSWKEKLLAAFLNFDKTWFSGEVVVKKQVDEFEKLAIAFVGETKIQ